MKTIKTVLFLVLLATSSQAGEARKPKTVVACYVATLEGSAIKPVRTGLSARRAAELAHDLNALSGKRVALAICDLEPAGSEVK